MPKMNGFDFCVKVFELDVNPRVCFMSSELINQAENDDSPGIRIYNEIKKYIENWVFILPDRLIRMNESEKTIDFLAKG